MERGHARIPVGSIELAGNLLMPEGGRGLVVFVHGSGSSRLSPRNRFVAGIIRSAGIGTLLFDLLTEEEEARDNVTAELRFNIPLLAERLQVAVRWARANSGVDELAIGLFGASTGAAAALSAAAEAPSEVAAVVSRGGRPDLAGDALARVRAPTLLIVGSLDRPVIAMNQQAFDELQCEKQVTIIPGASHLFEEPGTLDQVARFAAGWFQRNLTSLAAAPGAGSKSRALLSGEPPQHAGI
jgi:putative phosphoribosyl transferase